MTRVRAMLSRHFSRPSTYLFFVLWSMSGFGYQPTFGAFILHVAINPVLMLAFQELAYYEGWKSGTHHGSHS